MSRFEKLSHVLWHCTYHIIWTPKYRFRVLEGEVKKIIEADIHKVSGVLGCKVVALNLQVDHVHLLVRIPPKLSVSKLMGTVKGKTAIRVFHKLPQLKKKPYWGNHFWANGYCVDTVGINEEMVRKYVKFQEENEKKHE